MDVTTTQGVGIAREIARRCIEASASRWLFGKTSMNDQTISDFRVDYEIYGRVSI